jgi:hypothetical protein
MVAGNRSFAVLALAISVVVLVLLPLHAANCADRPVPLWAEATRPGAPGPIPVSVGFWLADISTIDSAAQTFSANLFFALSWRDPSLADGQPGFRQYNLKDIWHPNWVIVNAVTRLEPALREIVDVAGDGTVYYRQRVLGSFTQALDLRKFPFDHAAFGIHFVMVGLRPADVQFVANQQLLAMDVTNAAGIAPHLTLQDWRVSEPAAHSASYQVAPGLEFAGYAFGFRADRLQQHYIVKVMIPLLLIVMMSWLVFWISHSLGTAKISIGVTSMLTLIAYRFTVGNDVPRLPYLTLLDAFILISTILVFLALIEVVTSTGLWFSGRQELAQAIDRRSRVIFPVVFVALIAAAML